MANAAKHQPPLPEAQMGPAEKLLDLVVAAEETVAKMAEHAADKVVATTLDKTSTLAALRARLAAACASLWAMQGCVSALLSHC